MVKGMINYFNFLVRIFFSDMRLVRDLTVCPDTMAR